jgi:hypothetical protein
MGQNGLQLWTVLLGLLVLGAGVFVRIVATRAGCVEILEAFECGWKTGTAANFVVLGLEKRGELNIFCPEKF